MARRIRARKLPKRHPTYEGVYRPRMHVCPHCGQEIRVDRMLEHVLTKHPDKKWSESIAFFSELNRDITLHRTTPLDAMVRRTNEKGRIKGSGKKAERSRRSQTIASNKNKKTAVRRRRKYSNSRCQICEDDFVNFYFSKKADDGQLPSGGRICQACYSFLKREGKSSGYWRYSYASASKSVYTVNSGQTGKGYRY